MTHVDGPDVQRVITLAEYEKAQRLVVAAQGLVAIGMRVGFDNPEDHCAYCDEFALAGTEIQHRDYCIGANFLKEARSVG
jgi:hypothetical protein